MHFQTEGEAECWSEPLYHFYPQLDRTFAASLPVAERRDYIERTMRAAYAELENTIDEKVTTYSHHWNACKAQITAALSEAFGIDCTGLFNDLRCNLSLNPIEPHFLKEHCYVNVNYIFKKKRNLMFRKNGIIFFRIFYESLEACDSQFAIL